MTKIKRKLICIFRLNDVLIIPKAFMILIHIGDI